MPVQAVRQAVAQEGLSERGFKCFCDSAALPREHRLGLSRANVQLVERAGQEAGRV